MLQAPGHGAAKPEPPPDRGTQILPLRSRSVSPVQLQRGTGTWQLTKTASRLAAVAGIALPGGMADSNRLFCLKKPRFPKRPLKHVRQAHEMALGLL